MRAPGWVIVLFTVALAGCVPPTSQDGGVIAARSDAWEEAFQASDVDALVEFYTDDARFLPPNMAMTGRDGVRAVFSEMFAAGLTGELTTVEAVIAGDVGYNVGTYTLQTQDGRAADRGKFIEIWRRVGGEWKISNDIFNSDLPAGGPGTTLMAIHEVEDGDHWLAAWQGENSRHGQFAQHGVSAVRVFRSPEKPNLTGLLLQVEDVGAFEAFLASPEGQTAAREDGVKWDTLVMVAEVE